MENKKSKKKEIQERREKVLELIYNNTESEVAKILGVSRETVVRDVAYLKKSSTQRFDDFAKTRFILDLLLAINKLKQIGKMYESLLPEAVTVSEKSSIYSKMEQNILEYLEVLSGMPSVYAFRRALGMENVQSA